MPLRLVADVVHYPARDGVLLAADVIRADDAGPRPVLLVRTPYGRAGARGQFDVFALVRAGWTVVTTDTRGRGDSGGDGTPYVSEAADGADTLSWCAAQPWCDGRVAMTGASYLGLTQWQAAGTGHPALRAIAPAQAPLGSRAGWHYEGEAFQAMQAAVWATTMAEQDARTTPGQRARLHALSRDPLATLSTPPGTHPLRELYPPYDDWIRPDRTAFWSSFDVSPSTHPMDIAGYHLAGWYDLFCDSTIAGWRQLREHAVSDYARASQRLVIGHWPHGTLVQAGSDVDFLAGSDILTSGVLGEMYTWLGEAVAGDPVEGGVRVFVMGSNVWWDLPDWPPPAEPLTLYPTSGPLGARSRYGDGQLTTRPAPAGGDGFEHDPGNPVPTRGGRLLGHWRPLPGPYDQREVERRSDVLVYTSEPLLSALTIAGAVQLHVTFETSAVAADVTAKLVDVHPDGPAINLLDSVRRQPFQPGTPADVLVELGSVAHTFAPGHRIRLEIASSNAPRFNPNPSTGAPLGQPGPMHRAEQRVHHGGRTATRLVLPVVSGPPL